MAKTTMAQGDALTQIAWDEQLFRDALKDTFWERFRANSSRALVHSKTDAAGTGNRKKATRITFGLRMRLTGAGVTSGQTLEGNEENLVDHDYTLSLERYRHAVRDAGSLDRARPAYDMDGESRDAIQGWGTEKMDELHFDAIQNSPTRVFNPLDMVPNTTSFESAKDDLLSTHLPTPQFMSKLKTYAMTGGDRTIIPLRAIMVPGFGKVFMYITHPDALYDFVQDSTNQQNLREARERSKNHPLFMGAVGFMNDGVLLYAHENMNIGTDAGVGSDVPFAQGAFMGQQALVHAFGERPKTIGKTFDYEEEHGFAWAVTMKVEKPVFDSEDYGSFGVVTARTQISDAS
jgi:N4-gp56 family major capsid protein